MKLHRFMSEREFDSYMNGETLRNDTCHRWYGAHTNSVGFCFFPEEPEDAIRWLSGIVDYEVCVTFEVPESLVRKSTASYCDNDASDNSEEALFEDLISAMLGCGMPNAVTMEKEEYCCTEYNNKTFLMLDYKYNEKLKPNTQRK